MPAGTSHRRETKSTPLRCATCLGNWESIGKEAEIYHNGQVRPGIHSYGGWFHFVGTIETGDDGWSADRSNKQIT